MCPGAQRRCQLLEFPCESTGGKIKAALEAVVAGLALLQSELDALRLPRGMLEAGWHVPGARPPLLRPPQSVGLQPAIHTCTVARSLPAGVREEQLDYLLVRRVRPLLALQLLLRDCKAHLHLQRTGEHVQQ